MTESFNGRRILLRVVNVSTELETTRQSGDSPSSAPMQTVKVILAPCGISGFEVLGGQRIMLHISDPLHPLLASIAVDRVFELRPVDPEAR